MKRKVNIIKVVLGALLATVLSLSTVLFINTGRINNLNKQINNQQEIINKWESAFEEIFGEDATLERSTLTIIEVDGSEKEVKVYIILEYSILDVLLLNGYNESDFTSWDDNYYFGSNDPLKYAKTEVLELEEDPDYYDDWGSLVVGLNKIIMNRNYTVVRGYW